MWKIFLQTTSTRGFIDFYDIYSEHVVLSEGIGMDGSPYIYHNIFVGDSLLHQIMLTSFFCPCQIMLSSSKLWLSDQSSYITAIKNSYWLKSTLLELFWNKAILLNLNIS